MHRIVARIPSMLNIRVIGGLVVIAVRVIRYRVVSQQSVLGRSIDRAIATQVSNGSGSVEVFPWSNELQNSPGLLLATQQQVLDLLCSSQAGICFTIPHPIIGFSANAAARHVSPIEARSPARSSVTPGHVWSSSDQSQVWPWHQVRRPGVLRISADAWSMLGYRKTNSSDSSGRMRCCVLGATVPGRIGALLCSALKGSHSMSLHGSPRFARSLVASFLLLGLVVVAVGAVPQRAPTAHAAAGQLTQVTSFGTNPTGLQMWLYVPPTVKPHPAILLALHFCTGTGPVFFSGTEFANLADQFGFIVIYPSATRSGQCWDVSSPQALTRNGGSDPVGLMSMVSFVEQHNNGDASNVYVTGASSGAMMTNVLLAEYPDVFKAGSAFMGVPDHCFATTDGSMWNTACADGQIIMTAQQWGDLARSADAGYSGPRPRMQLWHGTADPTLNFANFGEEIKQWTNVLGVSQTASFTDSPQSGWTRTRYGGTGVNSPVEGVSVQGAGHVLPLTGQAAMAIQFMGLNAIVSSPTPTPTVAPTRTPAPTTTVTAPTATPTRPAGGAVCSVHYVVASQWVGGFTASVTITNTGSSTITSWSLRWTYANGQGITQIWNASETQSGSVFTAANLSFNGTIAPGGNVNFGFNGSWNGSNTNPTAFTLNGVSCTLA